DTVALGVATNRGFLIDCLAHDELASGAATTRFIPKHFAKPVAPGAGAGALALAAALLFEASARRHGPDPARTWSSSGSLSWPWALEIDGKRHLHAVSVAGARRYRVEA